MINTALMALEENEETFYCGKRLNRRNIHEGGCERESINDDLSITAA